MSERFHVFADGVQVHASHGEPKRITVLDGKIEVWCDGMMGTLPNGQTDEMTDSVLLVADRAFVQVESLQPGSIKKNPVRVEAGKKAAETKSAEARSEAARKAAKTRKRREMRGR